MLSNISDHVRHGLDLAIRSLIPFCLSLHFLLPLSIACTVYLYFYPILSGCAFPLPTHSPLPPSSSTDDAPESVPNASSSNPTAFLETLALHLDPRVLASVSQLATTSVHHLAPFRLLTLGDPQLEGDTSIPNAHGPLFPHLEDLFWHLTFQSSLTSVRQRIRGIVHELVDVFLEDIPNTITAARKRSDLAGNDFYLAHVYRTIHWWTRPTHVTVLGDLVGSQWIDDDEFDRRGHRFWKTVFAGSGRVPDDEALHPSDELRTTGVICTGCEPTIWAKRIINIPGNHDIGYAGDLTPERLARFIRVFGQTNYELRVELALDGLVANTTMFDSATNPTCTRMAPTLRIINLNDMNFDTPALSNELQDETYTFINAVIQSSSAVEFSGQFTIVLTHMPLFKRKGICVDGPFFDFHPEAEGGGVKAQNQLSADASRGFLEGIYGMSGNMQAPARGTGRPGLILNGHDHEGCDTYHYINQSHCTEPSDRAWQAEPWRSARQKGLVGFPGVPGMREITVRSMMGDFGGNAGLLSLWFDQADWEWRYEFSTCSLGTQHIWWFTHLLDLVTIVVSLYRLGRWARRRASGKARSALRPPCNLPSKHQDRREP